MKLKDVFLGFESDLRTARASRITGQPIEVKFPPAARTEGFYEFVFGLLIPLLVFMPAIISASLIIDLITEEYQHETLETLVSTPITFTEMVWGKILACEILVRRRPAYGSSSSLMNGIPIENPVPILILVSVASLILILLSALTALHYRERTAAQFIYSTALVVVILLVVAVPDNPLNLIVRASVGNAGLENLRGHPPRLGRRLPLGYATHLYAERMAACAGRPLNISHTYKWSWALITSHPREEPMSTHAPRFAIPCILAAAALLLTMPAAATLVLSGSTLTPGTLPLVPLQGQKIDVRIAVIPSGGRTFAIGHTLQMETDLLDARWNTSIIVDGYPGAQQASEGRVAFVNGFVLSYPTDRDVSVEISVSGAVPQAEDGAVMLMSVRELDNGGAVVPGSTVMIEEPVAAPTGLPVPGTSPLFTPVPEKTTASPSPTKAGDVLSITGIFAAGAGGIFYRWNQRKRDT